MLIWIIVIYIIVLLIVWSFYAVSRIHSMKFKNFSMHIKPLTNLLLLFLIILSLTWFILILSLNLDNSNYEISVGKNNNEKINGTNYENEIIGNEQY